MAKQSYRRGEESPPQGPRFRVVRIKALEQVNLSILGSSFHKYWTHWNGSRTEPCIEPRTDCEGCKRQWSQRWKAYLHVIREDRQEEGFLELTKLNRDAIRELCGPDELLRGSRIKAVRGKGEKTILRFMLLRAWLVERPEEVIPQERHPEDTLRALFEFRSAKPDGGAK